MVTIRGARQVEVRTIEALKARDGTRLPIGSGMVANVNLPGEK